MPAPPVYAPPGPISLIDDFCVVHDDAWGTVGHALLDGIERAAKDRGAVLSVVICPHQGGAKRAFLGRLGFEPTSEWHVRSI